jgi:hypothetical protein
MYFHEDQMHGVQNWGYYQPSIRLGDAVKRKQIPDQIQYIEAEVTRVTKDKRVLMSFESKGPMPDDKKTRFIKRFIDPMLKYELGRNLLVNVNQGNYPVRIAWRNGKFGFNGTIALDRPEAIGGKGSAAIIFIDEDAPDWKRLPTIVDSPDIGLFHELLHAAHIQRGTVVDNEAEMERQVIGIGKYTNAKGTENAYRDAKELQRRCCWDREKL